MRKIYNSGNWLNVLPDSMTDKRERERVVAKRVVYKNDPI